MFVGREAELKRLRQAYDGPKSELIPIYGRRRVGKTTLIQESLAGRRAIYLLGKTTSAQQLRIEFLRQAAKALGESLLATFPGLDWRSTLAEVVGRFPRGQKAILVFDEFQWLVGASPELPSIFQEFWDRQWQDRQSVALILCGSYVGFMEREVLGSKSPLFGRRTAQILLRPFNFREAALFHPNWSLVERARAYFICGGVAWYLRLLNSSVSVEANVKGQILTEHAPLYREPDFLLREELREVDRYYAVLTAIAAGHQIHGNIAKNAGLVERALPYYLQQLSELGYIERVFPLTGKAPAARHVRYRLADPLLRFWFRFVFPNLSQLAQHGPAKTFRERIKPDLATYEGACFERLCREALPSMYGAEGGAPRIEVGEYWSKTVQIDVVGRRNDGWVDLGECKWGTVRSLPKLAGELEAKLSHYPNPNGATFARWFFLRKRPNASRTPKVPNARWVGLEDLYSTPPG